MKKKFYIETLGCKVNQYESDGIASSLEEKGYIRGKKSQPADLCIINTCAVTSKAGMQSRQAIRKIIRNNPLAKIIVTGCHAQTDPDQIRKIENIDQIVCHRDKTLIADLIVDQVVDQVDDLIVDQNDKLKSNTNIGQDINPQADPITSIPKSFFSFKEPDHNKNNQFLSFEKPVQGQMTRAYLKIQDGCNAFCTYCIVPYARGSSVSMPQDEVFKHLEGLARAGFKEVILTGIHTGMYGLDLDPPTSLFNLVKKIDFQKPVDRIRISSIEPCEINEGLIDLACQDHILCDHFHIPLQSGDDEILQKMKRPYTSLFFEEMVLKIHGKMPFAGIGVDTLIGFPSETDKQFENTFKLIEKLPISYLHVFPFSARKGTPAYHFDNQVDPGVIKKRCARMRQLDKEKRLAFIRANMGRTLQGLVQQKEDKATGYLKAVTSNYLTILVKNTAGKNIIGENDSLKGKIVDLVYEQYDKDMNLIGKVVK
jgi:threonylcarbamoyladenosine tRNA methylthiotransferase MtaB